MNVVLLTVLIFRLLGIGKEKFLPGKFKDFHRHDDCFGKVNSGKFKRNKVSRVLVGIV
jgi:hypothetical protein